MVIDQYTKNGLSLNGNVYQNTSAPAFYADKQTQYFAEETDAFFQKYAKYSSEMFSATAQGLDYNDFYTWQTVNIRMADLISAQTGANLTEDWKVCKFETPTPYIGLGAKIHTTGNTYIVTNPANISVPSSCAVLQRCNALWKTLDYYGNTQIEPFVWAKGAALSTTNSATDNMVLANDYQHSIMQLNANTQGFTNNKRVILGNTAYEITGLIDFVKEFSDDENSGHILYFDLHRCEPLDGVDDMENKIANGLSFNWTIKVSGNPQMTVGTTQQLTASSLRNNEEITSTAQYPISYTWAIDDTSVATIDQNGLITAISDGTAVATVTLAQNTSITTSFTVEIETAQTGENVAFTTTVPTTLPQYSTATISAAYFENGEPQDVDVAWATSGADGCYTVESNGNTIVITCYLPSTEPLTLTASYNGVSATSQITLTGY